VRLCGHGRRVAGGPPLNRWWAELAWLGGDRDGVDERVLISADGDRLVAVEPGSECPPDAVRLGGLVLPGLANAHSHAFHRALRGRTQSGAGDFWAWRERMYRLAGVLEPDTYLALARATFAEMALAGVAAVGEFHYLHHPAGGGAYADPNAFGQAMLEAAAAAGIRITLLDTCYLQADVDGKPLAGVQRRFGDGDAAGWAGRVERLLASARGRRGAIVGAAIHSVRAVPEPAMSVVAAWARERGLPLHLHLSEQRAENRACLAATGRTPARLVADAGALSELTTVVHATHLGDGDAELLGAAGVTACICPTTERDLADGVGPARRLAGAGCRLALGSDGHSVIDLFEEARAVELDERLATERRGHHRPADLLRAATRDGMRSLGWDAGAIEPGRLADLVAVRLDSPRLAGVAGVGVAGAGVAGPLRGPAGAAGAGGADGAAGTGAAKAAAPGADPLAAVVFAASAADVTDLVVGGRQVVAGGRHLLVEDVPGALSSAVAALDRRS
jgi:formiminoglutamate deiminase